MSSTLRPGRALLLVAAALLLYACAEHSPSEPAPAQVAALSTDRAQTMVRCPSTVTRSISRTVGLLGGSLELDGTRVTIPFGAVLLPTRITLTLPASEHMEVDLTANALEHFEFPVPVTVSIDYARCPASAIDDNAPLSVWYIDTLLDTLLENMGGSDDRNHRVITFTTIHFSGFSIAQ